MLARNTPARHAARLRGGFSLTEAMLAITITALAGSVLLLAVDASLNGAGDAKEKIIADGLARQLIDEVLTRRYSAAGSGPTQWPLSYNSYEGQGAGRERYDDADDYCNFTAQPAKDAWGVEMGQGNGAGGTRPANFRLPASYFAKWKQKVEVYYVNASNLSQRLASGQTSNFRCVEVQIRRIDADGTERIVSQLRRVFAYVPSPL